ncbi:IS200/IS605 family transposase [Synechococcus sp. WC10meta]|uniref:IS200/IS605 family transposase n=1 Tax=Synechococcus sp. WC10meta TaxID=2964537 RepID=UPI0039C15A5C
MKDDFVSSGRAVSDLKAHLVLTTKYRRQVLTAEMLQRLHEILYNLCQKWNCKLIEFNGEVDHAHLLFQYYPQITLSKFVNNIKSVSSRRLRSEFTDRRIYRKDVLWNESYFIASCGGVTVSVLRQYIENQGVPASHPDPSAPRRQREHPGG